MKSPFKFLDAFELRDRDVFFGRDEEIDQLYQMVNKNRLVLVYGQSGTGKTSLVQCGLASRYDATDWLPLFVRRGNDLNRSLAEAMTRAQRREPSPQANPESVTPEDVEAVYAIYLRPLYLIFDQFEELFILGNADEQRQFIKTIAHLHRAELPCRILFIIREEYLAALYDFEKTIPSLFDRRLRIEPMNASKVEDVLRQTFGRFNIGLEDLAYNLQQIVDKVSDRRSGISLPYLQIYLDQLWREDFERTYRNGLPPAPDAGMFPPLTFQTKEIEAFGEISEVMRRFLPLQRREIQQKFETMIRETPDMQQIDLKGDETARLLDVFVTEEGTKRPVTIERQDENITLKDIPDETLKGFSGKMLSICLDLLEKGRLIRVADNRAELAHDSLAALIDKERSDEQRQLNEVKNRLKNAAREYKVTGEFLSRKQLLSIEDFLPKLNLSEDIQKFVFDSQNQLIEAEEQLKREAEEKARKEKEKFKTLQESSILLAYRLSFLWNQMQSENFDVLSGERTLKQIIEAITRTLLEGREVGYEHSEELEIILNNLANGRIEDAILKTVDILASIGDADYYYMLFFIPRYRYLKSLYDDKTINEESFIALSNKIAYGIIAKIQGLSVTDLGNMGNTKSIANKPLEYIIINKYIDGIIKMLMEKNINKKEQLDNIFKEWQQAKNKWGKMITDVNEYSVSLGKTEYALLELLLNDKNADRAISEEYNQNSSHLKKEKTKETNYCNIQKKYYYLLGSNFKDEHFEGHFERILEKSGVETALQLLKNYNFSVNAQIEVASLLFLTKKVKRDYNSERISEKEYKIVESRLLQWVRSFIQEQYQLEQDKKIIRFGDKINYLFLTIKNLIIQQKTSEMFNVSIETVNNNDMLLAQAQYYNLVSQTKRQLISYDEEIRGTSRILYFISELLSYNNEQKREINYAEVPYTAYKILDLTDCGIDTIPEEVEFMSDLKELRMQYNFIKAISNAEFLPKSLVQIDLRNNPIPKQEKTRIQNILSTCKILF